MLVSSVLNFQTLRFGDGNDLPYLLYLPSYAVTARYHRRLESKYLKMDEDKFIGEVRDFAQGDYNLALMKGDKLGESERDRVRGQRTEGSK